MISILLYLKEKKDADRLSLITKDLIADMGREQSEIRQMSALQELQAYISQEPLVHLIIFDICDRAALECLPGIRRKYPQSRLMVLADVSVSPMQYIRPELRVDALLLKPWSKQQAEDVLHSFFEEYMASAGRGNIGDAHSYIVETREGTISLPYEQICFFEAREKKIYVCIGKEEYGFYSSIDKLSEELPPYFVRCHRSFIVNTKKIRRIVFSQNVIYLGDGFDIPLSRSYKAALKEMSR